MQKFLEYISEAERKIKIADHFIYMTFPIVRDNKLLLKILSELNSAILNCISAILQYEYIYKRISLTKDAKSNFQIFIQKCSPRYDITEEEIKQITNLINLAEKHKRSPFEFVRGNKVVILSDNLQQETLTIEKIKKFLETSKILLKKTKQTITK